ncbi:MAG: putative transcriptional regulator [Candidatus Woesearchaeota archaeon]|jgi:predicted transcriptional regulator
MNQEELKLLGMTVQEYNVYHTLLVFQKAATSSTVASKCNIDERSVYDYLERLVSKGLVGDIYERNTRYFLAHDPDILNQLGNEESNHYGDFLDELEQLKTKAAAPSELHIVRSLYELWTITRDTNTPARVYVGSTQTHPYLTYMKKKKLLTLKSVSEISKDVIAVFTESFCGVFSKSDDLGFIVFDSTYAQNLEVYFDEAHTITKSGS